MPGCSTALRQWSLKLGKYEQCAGQDVNLILQIIRPSVDSLRSFLTKDTQSLCSDRQKYTEAG